VQAYTTVKGVNVYGGSSSAVYAGLSLT